VSHRFPSAITWDFVSAVHNIQYRQEDLFKVESLNTDAAQNWGQNVFTNLREKS
jgi:hypothetical protein